MFRYFFANFRYREHHNISVFSKIFAKNRIVQLLRFSRRRAASCWRSASSYRGCFRRFDLYFVVQLGKKIRVFSGKYHLKKYGKIENVFFYFCDKYEIPLQFVRIYENLQNFLAQISVIAKNITTVPLPRKFSQKSFYCYSFLEKLLGNIKFYTLFRDNDIFSP